MIGWHALKSDLLTGRFTYEFGVFEEYALRPSLENEAMMMDAEAPGGFGSNLRLGFAMAELNKHMALAVQSIWEAAFRRFVRSCAHEVLGEDSTRENHLRDAQLRKATVERLGAALQEIRGVALADLPGGATLLKMVLIGNVVRHGDGPSCAKLREEAPDLWLGNVHEGMDGVDLHDVADDLCIRTGDVARFAQTVSEFWLAVSETYRAQNPVEAPAWVTGGTEGAQ